MGDNAFGSGGQDAAGPAAAGGISGDWQVSLFSAALKNFGSFLRVLFWSLHLCLDEAKVPDVLLFYGRNCCAAVRIPAVAHVCRSRVLAMLTEYTKTAGEQEGRGDDD